MTLKHTKQRGYSAIELIIVIVIVGLLASIALDYFSDYSHRLKIDRSANDFSLVVSAVQRRNAHDGFLFSFWDENGGRTPTNSTITWSEGDEFRVLLNNFLVGRDNNQCGQAAAGWNPVNTGGRPDEGPVTIMERTALVPCNKLRGQLPWRITASAALSPDTTGAVGTFALYLNLTSAYFENKDKAPNNILNFTLLRNSIERRLEDGINGVPRVSFTRVNTLADIEDDQILTSRECELDLSNCAIGVYIDFSGTTNGMFKRTDNQDYFLDDITIGSSVAGGRQRCAFWEKDLVSDTWVSIQTDCGIKGGAGDTRVTLVVDDAQSQSLKITNEVGITHICRVFTVEDRAAGIMALRPSAAPGNVTPCGFTREGNIVQMMSEESHVGTLYGEEVIADSVFASQTTLYSNIDGQVMLRIYDSSHSSINFSVDNNGNTSMQGALDVGGVATFRQDAIVENDLSVQRNANFLMAGGGTIQMGLVSDDSSLTFSRNGAGTFTIGATGSVMRLESEQRLELSANDGVATAQGTTLHTARSTLRNDWFGASGINTDALKSLSEVVTADMAKYLDDTSSPIQIVGIDRIEGEFATLTKPNCLAFALDSNYSSPDANPYRDIITQAEAATGHSYARLVLIPIFMKTFNAAFGDNQIYSQHGVHSSPTTWDIYLYLSGEGAFSTGAREDGAGASLAMSMCDYSGLNISRQSF